MEDSIMKSKWYGMGIAVLLMAIMIVCYGGWCNSKSDDDDTSSGSSDITINAPSNLTATITSGNVILLWQDNSDNETGFALYVKAYNDSGWTLYSSLISVNSTSYSFPLSDLAEETGNFQLSLTAYYSEDNETAESSASNIVNISW